ncbi:glycosyl hydrolase 53 family protein [Crocinitomix algicola]|uniref:glycosyl hydrolase 53 family protein n=1 Tax=Crocinitomix algicola TaxID=1740263 RepID=UPI0015868149|nr:glycosyl hydrolase 53 family protein [Crocinitomix algicola]
MKITIPFLVFILLFSACKKNNPKKLIEQRHFKMGFTTWPYGPEPNDVASTYNYVKTNGDIYAEHIDDYIPWNHWINGEPLPEEYSANIAGKIAQRSFDQELLLSVSFLNNARNGIKEDLTGNPPIYEKLNDEVIVDAYTNHIIYLIEGFQPQYLVLSIESNDFLINNPEEWEDYRLAMTNVRTTIKALYPHIMTSESVTLHNWYENDSDNATEITKETDELVNEMDFAAISFYPFFKGLNKRKEFQKAFDFLHDHTQLPIAFVETSHLANDLNVEGLNLHIKSSEKEQEEYLSTLLINAHNHDYKFIIWWAHRDFDALWETFPVSLKDLGKIWRDTGILDENGENRKAAKLWTEILDRN